MAKKKKKNRPRASRYDEKLAIKGTFKVVEKNKEDRQPQKT